jgi:hypothetical protein
MTDANTFIYSIISATAAFFLILKLAKAKQPDVCGLRSQQCLIFYRLDSWITSRQSDRQDSYPLTLVLYATFAILDELSKKDVIR